MAVQDSTPAEADRSTQTRVVELCRRFREVAGQLAKRHGRRTTLIVEDEYDVQDLMHALLWIDFQDVRAEEHTPSYAGGSSRIDFILKREQIALETKFAHKEKRGRRRSATSCSSISGVTKSTATSRYSSASSTIPIDGFRTRTA